MMKVSIITATYNSAMTIKDTILSVLMQDYNNIEHIIIDGNSNDETIKIINSCESSKIVKIISEPDRGIYDAMNKGIKLATGDIIGILNSDDFFTDNNIISKIVDEFRCDSSLEGVHGDLYYVKRENSDHIVRYWLSSEYISKSFYYGWHPAHPTLYLRKRVYNEYGLFDLDFPLAADFELMLRLFECYKIKTKYLHIPMIRMRLGGATSKDYSNLFKNTSECIKAFKKNNLKYSIFYPFFRLVPKLFQYLKIK